MPSMTELAAKDVAERQDKARTFLAGLDDTALALCPDMADLHYVWDTMGRMYVDLTSGGGALPMGAHRLVSSALWGNKDVAYPYIGPYGASCQHIQVKYAQAISERFPLVYDEPQQVFFTASGEEAMTLAQRMAQFAGISHVNIKPIDPYTYTPLDTGMAQKMCALVEDQHDWRHKTRLGRAIIVDERLSGYGRLGSFRAASRYGLDEHAERMITVLGEAGGGGVPFGAVVAPRSHFPPQARWLASRHGGSPLACGAGLAILAMQDDMFYGHVLDGAAALATGCEDLASQFPDIVVAQHARGMAAGLVINDAVDMDLLDIALLNNGVIVTRNDHHLLLAPPLIMTVTAIGEAFNQLAAALVDASKLSAGPASTAR